MKNTNGRLEKEIQEMNKIKLKLATLPRVIQTYYHHLEASDKTYATIKVYINYVENFMNYCTNSMYDEYFYKNVTSATINEYMSSLRYKTDSNGNVIKVGNGIRATRWSALNTFFIYLKLNQPQEAVEQYNFLYTQNLSSFDEYSNKILCNCFI